MIEMRGAVVDEIRVAALLRHLTTRWRTIVAAMVAGGLVGLASYLVLPPNYVATAQIYIAAQRGSEDATSAYQAGLLSAQRVKTYTQLVTGERVARATIAQLGLPEDVDEFSDKVSAAAQSDTVLISIAAEDRDPVQAAAIANTTSAVFAGVVAEIEQPPNRAEPPVVVAKLVQPAVVPTNRTSPKLGLLLPAGLLAGLLLSSAILVTIGVLDKSVRDESQLSEAARAPVLSSIPYDDESRQSPLVVRERPNDVVAEMYRHVRTNLQYVDVDSPVRVVLVTSALAAEGKSTVAINLASALAIGGAEVALVEADLRKPSLARYSGVDGAVGVTDVLAGRLGVEHALQRISPRLLMMASGAAPPNPSELMASQAMRDILAQLSSRFDYVIVDAPPVLAVTDAAAMASSCDGVMLVCKYGGTSRTDARRAADRLRAGNARVVGALLTMAPRTSREYSYYTEAVGRSDGQSRHQANVISSDKPDIRPSPAPRSQSSAVGRAPNRY